MFLTKTNPYFIFWKGSLCTKFHILGGQFWTLANYHILLILQNLCPSDCFQISFQGKKAVVFPHSQVWRRWLVKRFLSWQRPKVLSAIKKSKPRFEHSRSNRGLYKIFASSCLCVYQWLSTISAPSNYPASTFGRLVLHRRFCRIRECSKVYLLRGIWRANARRFLPG